MSKTNIDITACCSFKMQYELPMAHNNGHIITINDAQHYL